MIKRKILFILLSFLLLTYFFVSSNRLSLMLLCFIALCFIFYKFIMPRLDSKFDFTKKLSIKKNCVEVKDKPKKKTLFRKFKSLDQLFKLALSLLLMSMTIMLFISLTDVKCSIPLVLLVGAVFTFLIWLEWGRRTSVYGVLLFVFGYILIGFLMKNRFALNSVLIFYNQMAEKLAMTGLFSPNKYIVDVAELNYSLYMTYFVSLFSAFAGLVAYVVAAHKQYLFMYIYMAFIGFALFLGFEVDAYYLIGFIFIALLIIAYNRYKEINIGYVFTVSGVLLISLLSLLIGESLGSVLSLYESPYEILCDSISYKSNTTDSYGDGKISGNKLYKSSDIALQITMEKPKPLYLKGFIGCEFNGVRWLSEDAKTIYDNRQLFYILGKNEFSSYSQAAKMNFFIDPDAEDNNASIKYIGTKNKNLYLPYELKDIISSEYYLTEGDNLKRKPSESLEYTFSMTSSLYQKQLTLYSDNKSRLIGQSYIEFDICEENYKKFVYDNYLNVTSEDMKAIKKAFKRNDVSIDMVSNSNITDIIEKVREVINNELSYDENVKLSTFDTHAVSTLLNKKKSGYDIHYATLATLMFRTLGVPARYVEGYVIGISDSLKIKAEKAYNVSGKFAHAWTEIYVEDAGWTPVEIYQEDYERMFAEPLVLDNTD